MDGETFHIAPNAVVIMGARSMLSAVGLIVALGGYWHMENKWDNEGSAAVREQEGNKQAYVEMREHERIQKEEQNERKAPPPPVLVDQKFHPNGAREMVRVSTMDSKDDNYHPVEAAAQEGILDPESARAARIYGPPEVLQAKLREALPLPTVMLGGFLLWTISFLFDPNVGGFRVYANAWNIISLLLAGSIGPLIAFPIRNATIERNVDLKKKAITVLIILSAMLCITATADPIVDAPWFFNVFGGESDNHSVSTSTDFDRPLDTHFTRAVIALFLTYLGNTTRVCDSPVHAPFVLLSAKFSQDGVDVGIGCQAQSRRACSKSRNPVVGLGCLPILGGHQWHADCRSTGILSSPLYQFSVLVCLHRRHVRCSTSPTGLGPGLR